ncbi:MAG: hypothetical protein V3R81_01915 [Gammaproteobacteria bacterium]
MIKSLMCRARGIAGLTCMALLTVATGCVGQLHTPYRPNYDAIQPHPSLPEADPTVFSYEAATPTQTPRRSTRKYYDTVQLKFPPLQNGGSPAVQLAATYYRSQFARNILGGGLLLRSPIAPA